MASRSSRANSATLCQHAPLNPASPGTELGPFGILFSKVQGATQPWRSPCLKPKLWTQSTCWGSVSPLGAPASSPPPQLPLGTPRENSLSPVSNCPQLLRAPVTHCPAGGEGVGQELHPVAGMQFQVTQKSLYACTRGRTVTQKALCLLGLEMYRCLLFKIFPSAETTCS